MGRKKAVIEEAGGWFAFPRRLLRSDAWWLLSHAERDIYLTMRDEWSRQCENNYGKAFVVPHGDLPASTATIYSAIRHLVKLGLLVYRQEDHGGICGNPSRYFLSGKWRDYEPTADEKAWLVAHRAKWTQRREKARARRIQVHKEAEVDARQGR